MRKHLETAPLKEEKQRPEKTGAMQQNTTDILPRLVIIGADFGGHQDLLILREADPESKLKHVFLHQLFSK